MRSAQEDGMRTQPFGAGDGLCGMDAVLARFVGGRRDHTASIGIATDDHRLALEGRITHLLHRNKKRVHVDM